MKAWGAKGSIYSVIFSIDRESVNPIIISLHRCQTPYFNTLLIFSGEGWSSLIKRF